MHRAFIIALVMLWGCGSTQTPARTDDDSIGGSPSSGVAQGGSGGAGQGGGGQGGGSTNTTAVVAEIGPFVAGVHGMAVAPDGALYFSDSFKNMGAVAEVYRVPPPYTAAPEPIGIRGQIPAGLLWTEDGLYVCDTGARTVVLYDSALTALRTWTDIAAWNVVRHPRLGMVAVTFDGSVVHLDDNGTNNTLWSGALAPFDLAVGPTGDIWLSEQGANKGDPGRLTHRPIDNSNVTTIAYPWANPEGMAFGNDGRLYVAETERGELVAINSSGSVEVVRDDLELPVVIVPDADSGLLVSTGGPAPKLFSVTFVN